MRLTHVSSALSESRMSALPRRPVVYTAITDGYDVLKQQPHAAVNGAAFVAFLDRPQESPLWRSYPIHTDFADPTRNAKIHKILSHRYLPEAEYTLWIDGSVTIVAAQPLQHLIDTCLAECDVAVFRHRLRTCVYQEASVCLERCLDEPEIIWQQMCRYTGAGFPPTRGWANAASSCAATRPPCGRSTRPGGRRSPTARAAIS